MVHGFRTLYKGTHCFFKQLRLLRQASVLKLDPAGGSQESLFWSPREGVEPDMSYEEAVAGVRDLMLDAVQLRLRADVPLSFCMSGGVDSNVLISIAKRIFGFDVHGFTFTSGDVRYDEMCVIKQSVKELDIRHTLVTAQTENFIPRLRELLVYHDAPVHTVTWYANWLLMEAIAGSGYKISTSGIGADEMFSGYFDHHLAYLYDMRSLSEVYDLALADWKKYVQPLVRDPVLRNPRLYIDQRWTPSTGQLINVAKWNLLRYLPVKMRGAEDDQEDTAQSFASV